MKLAKKIARKYIFPTAIKIGVDGLIRHQAKNSIINIMYHGVVNDDSCYFSPRHIEKIQFENHLKYFKNNFSIISTDEAFEKISNKETLNRKYLTISFDDGFKNNLTTALPLLEKYNIPTTFFISSICVNNNDEQYLWSELAAALNYFYKDEVLNIEDLVFEKMYNKKNKISFTDYIKKLSYYKRNNILLSIEEKFQIKKKIKSIPEEIWKLLNKEEIIKLSKSKVVQIGSHCHEHFNLGQIEINAAKEELEKSKYILEKLINKPINSVAYPDGSYNESIKNLAFEIGYKYQFAVNYKSANDIADNRIMNRHGISSTTTYESNILNLNKIISKKGNR